MFSSQNSQVSNNVNYIEDVFSTYLYTGTSAAQTITNGINLATNGGLVWTKSRSNAISNINVDTVRGGTNALITDLTNASSADPGFHISSFNSNGYSLQGAGSGDNLSGYTYVSWTFREQPKFFDVVTYTGNGSSITVPHSLGSAPGCIIVKRTNTTSDWPVYHRSVSDCGFLNYTNSFGSAQRFSSVTSTDFTINVSTADVNASGGTYVAYLFAHNAGGFGLTGTDNVISCGSFTASASETATVTLGYEPQFLLFKPSSTTGDWQIVDTMRRWPVASDAFSLKPNTSAAEANFGAIKPSATGFYATSNLTANATYIYIAIRRGPMKVPTLGTSVFAPVVSSANTGTITSGFPTDLVMSFDRTTGTAGFNRMFQDRLRGKFQILDSATTAAETSNGSTASFDSNTGIILNSGGVYANGFVHEQFRRAPGFFDEVCYTGTGSLANTQNHNLTVVPELIITKIRSGGTESGVGGWGVYAAPLGITKVLELNSTVASATDNWFQTAPTASVFTVYGNDPHSNRANGNYVAYLFATVTGVSKVGSYTGTGALQTVACGFTSGARFVLIKRTDSTGDWYVWDSARGITSGNDPYLLLNSTAAEVTSTNYVDTDTTGFKVTAAAPAALNAVGGTYIFLAIA